MSIAKCLSQVETALVNFDLYESCYEGLLKIPFVSNLKEHNDLLLKQVKCLTDSNAELLKYIATEKETRKWCSQNNNVSYTISESSSDDSENEPETCEESEYEGENETDSDDDSEYETNDELEETEEVDVVEETEEVDVEEETEEVVVEEETEEVEVEEEEVEVEETEEVEVEETEEVEVEETEEVEVEETEEVEVEEEEEGVELIMIGDVNYFTSNTMNGEIYKYIDDENVGDLIGRFQESVPLWY